MEKISLLVVLAMAFTLLIPLTTSIAEELNKGLGNLDNFPPIKPVLPEPVPPGPRTHECCCEVTYYVAGEGMKIATCCNSLPLEIPCSQFNIPGCACDKRLPIK